LLALVAVGCATTALNLPAVTDAPTGQFQPGKIIWRDLITDQPSQSRRFYGALFGWEFEPVGSLFGLVNDDTYTLIRHNGRLIGGMVDANQLDGANEISQWVVLMSVADIDAAVASFEQRGTVLTPPTDIADRGKMAVVVDPQGALLALLQTAAGDPVDREPELGDFLWDELWTADVDAATSFYGSVAGFEPTDVAVNAPAGSSYRLLQVGGRPRVGVMANPFEDQRPVWVSYVRVDDPAAITAQVESLGGQIYAEAQSRPLGGEVAFIAGPSGAGIALQTWPLERPMEIGSE